MVSKRDEAIEIIPGEGTDVIRFTMNFDEVEVLLGAPETVVPISNIPGYPDDRVRWDYGSFDILFTRAHGVISITLDCEMTKVRLWGHSLGDCDADALVRLIKQVGESMVVREQDQSGDFGIFLPNAWLDFALSENNLLAVEVQKPDWRRLDKTGQPSR